MTEETTNEQKSETITIKKDSLWKYATFVLAAIVIIGLIVVVLPGKSTTGNVIDNNPGNAPVPTERVKIEIQDGDHVAGSPDAKVKIFEFSDFQCPFCSRAAPTVKQIESQYGDEVAIIYKQFPLTSIHPEAEPAALASECAAEQGKFWEYHDLLFANQQILGDSNYKAWAGQLGLDQTQFDTCLDTKKYADKVKADLTKGASSGVTGTPGFLVNGRIISGACPFGVFEQAIKAEQEGKDWAVTRCNFALL